MVDLHRQQSAASLFKREFLFSQPQNSYYCIGLVEIIVAGMKMYELEIKQQWRTANSQGRSHIPWLWTSGIEHYKSCEETANQVKIESNTIIDKRHVSTTVYLKWKKCNEIKLRKNKVNFNNRKKENHPLPPVLNKELILVER